MADFQIALVIALGIAWAVITLVGHASWLILEKLFSLFSGSQRPADLTSNSRHVIAKSVIHGLHKEGRIDETTMNNLVHAINTHKSGQPLDSNPQQDAKNSFANKTTEVTANSDNGSQISEKLETTLNSETEEPKIVVATLINEVEPQMPPREEETESAGNLSSSDPPKPQHVSRFPDPQTSDITQKKRWDASPTHQPPGTAEVITNTTRSKPRPTISTGEIIQSFLSAHNIRWGELIAGILIVVCSIGLVISLWGPLVQTHRAIPTLIFLAANAAIYSVGLYTLSRWRLRHTSRAVLIIATLLIPLSVLAGIAAAGIDASRSLDLSDPITLTTIGIAGIVYSVFLYFGGKALTSPTHVWSIFTSVAGPVVALVFAPAAIRVFESQAGWLLAIGSASVVFACAMLGKLNRRTFTKLGPAGARIRLLVMGLSAYSLAIAAISMAYHLRGFDSQALLPLAMASIPAWLSLAGLANSLRERSRNSSVSMVGAVCCVLLSAITLVIFAPAMVSPTWLWTWALTASVSLVAGRYLFQQPSWYALSTLPVGLVATCTAQVWLGSQTWQASALWTKFINGEAMTASLMMCATSASLWWALSQNAAKRWLQYANGGWIGATLLIAAVLSLTPEANMGVIPNWVVTATLFFATLATFLFSLRDPRFCYATAVSTALAFNSIYKLQPSLSLDSIPSWIYLALSIAGALTVLSELSCRIATRISQDCADPAFLVRKQLASISCVTIIVALVLAFTCRQSHFELCCATHILSAIALVWISLLLGNLNVFKVAQISTLLLTISLTLQYLGPELWTKAAWLSGNAIWRWTAILGVLGLCWYLIREVITLYLARLSGPHASSEISAGTSLQISFRDRIARLFGQPIPPVEMPDSWFGFVAASLATAATTYLFFNLNRFTISPLSLAYDTSWIMPALGWLSVGAFAGLLARQRTQKEISSTLTGLLGILFILWFSCQLAVSILSDVKTMLIVAVSLATALFLIAKTTLRYKNPSLLSSHFVNAYNATQCLVLFTASLSLLYSGVFVLVANGQLADVSSVGSIAAWWFIVSMLALWQARRTKETWILIFSAMFFAAAGTVLTTPFTIQSPIWLAQVACLLTFIWLILASRILKQNSEGVEDQHKHNCLHTILRLLMVVGTITSVVCTTLALLKFRDFDDLLSPAGFTLSLIAAANTASHRVQRFFSGKTDTIWYLSIPFSISLLAGQIAWILNEINITTSAFGSPQSVEIITGVWILAAVVFILMAGRRQHAVDFYQMAGATLITVVAASYYKGQSEILPWLSLIAMVASGTQITLMSIGKSDLKVPITATRGLGWLVGSAGIVLPWQFIGFNGSYMVLWITAWILIWRYVTRDRNDADRESKLTNHVPTLEFTLFLFATAFVDLAHGLGFIADPYSLSNPMLWLRTTCYALTAVSIIFRPRTSADWFIALTMLSTAFSLLVIAITEMLGGSPAHKYTAAIISYAFFFVVSTASLGNLAKLAGRISSSRAELHFKNLVSATISILTIVAVVSVSSPIIMMIARMPLAEVQIAIASVAMIAWAFVEIADQASLSKLRHVAISLGLVAIALWASANSLDTEHFLLTACMRWLVASALIIPTLLFVLPKLIGERIRTRWLDAFQKGAITTVAAALCSTFAMITLEFILRDSNGIDSLSLVIVIGAGITMGALSLMSGATVLATGPQGILRSTISISDQQRTYLLLATQLLGFLTWLHIFLCRPAWAFAGMRENWPYVVMGLAFTSVGITEFARRRGDAVMANTIRKTALYLPLIPMLGLWLSASNQDNTILTNMIESDYEILLVMAAVYYFAAGTMWKSTMPRVTGVILGNAAWWFVLVQMPGWGFMMHPQLWLIPPAACVLAMTHFYRDRLDSKLASGIRYSATLLIYISSSADMLLQQIGTTLAGPVILILLALAGMLLGVILRIRPFLYLGATFVFLGVASMVWHAHQAFESTWPWWVFGISMGLLLLTGLMMLERFKPQLQAYAKTLSTWDS